MTTTDSNGIVFLEETDAISPFHTLINGLQTGTSNAIGQLNPHFATTGARDTALPSPTEGDECTTGTGAAMVKWLYFNSAWRDVTVRPGVSYAPTLTGSTTNPTLGTGGATSGRLVQIGKLAIFWFTVSFGTSGASAGSGTYGITLPVNASVAATGTAGAARLYDSSTGQVLLGARVALGSATQAVLQYVGPQTALGAYGGIGNVSNSAPWAWANGDLLDGFIIYEVA